MPINMSSSILNPNAKQPGGPGAGTQNPNSPFQPTPVVVTPPTNNEPIPVVVEPSSIPSTNNPFAGLGGSSKPFYGEELPWYMRSSGAASPAPEVTVNVTNTGSVIMQDEFVTAVTDAVTIGLGQGLQIKPPGSLPDFR
jgi:hypothetical protein